MITKEDDDISKEADRGFTFWLLNRCTMLWCAFGLYWISTGMPLAFTGSTMVCPWLVLCQHWCALGCHWIFLYTAQLEVTVGDQRRMST